MPITPLTILIAILGLAFLMVVHEAGHYFAARAFGMRVLRFGVGFGKTLWEKTPEGSETTFSLGAVPFGAYVQIDGMNPFEERDEDDPRLFNNAPFIGRVITIVAGPLANYLAASVILFGILMVHGKPVAQDGDVVATQVAEGRAAARAGVQTGDVLVAVDGTRILRTQGLIDAVNERGGRTMDLTVRRDGQELHLEMTPEMNEELGRAIIGVNIQGQSELVDVGVGEATVDALVQPWTISWAMLQGLGRAIGAGDGSNVSGPLDIVNQMSKAAQRGALDYIHMVAIISIALGMFNLLPIPALDGGRLVFLGAGLLTGGRIGEEFEAKVHAAGMLVLLTLIVLVTGRDLVRIVQEPDEPPAASAPAEPSPAAE